MSCEAVPDLGDILGVKVGDKVAALHFESGRWIVKGFRPVTEVDGERVRMKSDRFLKSVGPWGYYFMSKRVAPDFYYSANPVHIAEAERKATEARNERERVATGEAAKRAALGGLGELLGDGERYTQTYAEPYLDTSATDVLAARLTVEQIETLKSWLKVN